MFWSNANSDTIEQAGLDGTQRRTLVNSGLSCACTSNTLHNMNNVQGHYYVEGYSQVLLALGQPLQLYALMGTLSESLLYLYSTHWAYVLLSINRLVDTIGEKFTVFWITYTQMV